MEGRIFSLGNRIISKGEESTIYMACLSTNGPNWLKGSHVEKEILKGLDCEVPGTMILRSLSI